MKSARSLTVVKIVLSLILVVGVIAAATGPSLSSPAFGKDNHGHGNSGKGKKHEGRDNEGKGNKGKKQHKKNGKHRNQGKKNQGKVKADPIVEYTIQVDCSYDSSSDQSTCMIDADNPPNGKKINLYDMPEDEICAPVVGGDAKYVDPDPNTGVTGYRSTDSDGRMTLVLAGEVTAGGTATYWIKAASAIFPASGQGLDCVEPETLAPQPTTEVTSEPTAQPQLTPEVTDSTGSVIVRSYLCPIAEPPAEFDWYGQCTEDSQGTRYRLLRLDTETRDGLATSTDETGRARFLSLQPGTYELTQAEGDWCYAQSDSVDADGNLIVEAGMRTTVWIFTCNGS